MDREAWWATVYGVTESQTRQSNRACTHTINLQCHIHFCHAAKWISFTYTYMGVYNLTTEHACIYPFIIYPSTYCQLLLLSSIISILTMMYLVCVLLHENCWCCEREFFFKIYLFFNWRIIALQNFVVFLISHSYTYIPSLLNLPPISFPSYPSRLIHGSKDEREFNLKLWCSCHQESWLLICPSRKFYKMCFGKDQACKHEYGRVDPPALIFWHPELPWDHPLPWLLQSAGPSP